MRHSGILLPVFSLPSDYGIGCFSKEAYKFIDYLSNAGQRYWQILPLTPPGDENSPYDPLSVFAGNTLFIDPETLYKDGLISADDLEELRVHEDSLIDYPSVKANREKMLRKAFRNFSIDTDYYHFCDENDYWLTDTALFYSLKNQFGTADWTIWPDDIKERKNTAMIHYPFMLKAEINYFKFCQYVFHKQWTALKDYANSKNVLIIGDMPIYTAFSGADCWAHNDIFQLNPERKMQNCSGCPPDAFSADGQKWNNPLYRWHDNKQSVYDFWKHRIERNFKLYDVLRIDHFRGLESYFSIPYTDENAINGHWEKGPGQELFTYIEKELGRHEYIAEDLGFITDEVKELISSTGFPGMKVLQFAYDSDESNAYLPDFYPENCVVYTGTHDNDTIRGWYRTLIDYKVRFVDWYIQKTMPELFTDMKPSGEKNPLDPESKINIDNISRYLTELALFSKANTCIIPLQDLLDKDSDARINTPGVAKGNWGFKLKNGEIEQALDSSFRDLCAKYNRI